MPNIEARKQLRYLVPEGLRQRWTLIIGYSQVQLPRLLGALGFCDIFIHDDLHTYDNMSSQYNLVWPYLSERGILVSDNVGLNSALSDFVSRNAISHIVIKDKHRRNTLFGVAFRLTPHCTGSE